MSSVLDQNEVDALLRGLHGGQLDMWDEDYEDEEIHPRNISMRDVSDFNKNPRLEFRHTIKKLEDGKTLIVVMWRVKDNIGDGMYESVGFELKRVTKTEIEHIIEISQSIANQTFRSGRWEGIDEGAGLAQKKMRQALGIEK